MNINDLHAGQGIAINIGSDYKDYGLIVNITDNNIEYVSVHKIINDSGIKAICYDDADAIYDYHKDNVRLKNCPPPFSDFITEDKEGRKINDVFVDMRRVSKLSKSFIEQSDDIEIIDNGMQIPAKTLHEVKYHPWPNEAERAEFGREVLYHDDNNDRKCDFSIFYQ